LIRAAASEGWIQDVDAWMAFIEARNLTSHSYKHAIAEEVFKSAKGFPPFVDRLIAALRQA
jgi:hypothetical protein